MIRFRHDQMEQDNFILLKPQIFHPPKKQSSYLIIMIAQ